MRACVRARIATVSLSAGPTPLCCASLAMLLRGQDRQAACSTDRWAGESFAKLQQCCWILMVPLTEQATPGCGEYTGIRHNKVFHFFIVVYFSIRLSTWKMIDMLRLVPGTWGCYWSDFLIEPFTQGGFLWGHHLCTLQCFPTGSKKEQVM